MKNRVAKPFLKWAGGKSQLIPQLSLLLPKEVIRSKYTYIEPFIGGGAMLFWLLNTYPDLEQAIINDANEDLINTYRTIASEPLALIDELLRYQMEYHNLSRSEQKRKSYFLDKRQLYNLRSCPNSIRAALFIFLNKTCFNGLYRVNSKNQFNVSADLSRIPTICDSENLLAVSKLLQRVEILCGDFEQTLPMGCRDVFYFIDPPYKPISKTANFNAYACGGFGDNDQTRLRDHCVSLDEQGCLWMLCNSDPKSNAAENSFFENLYRGYNFYRVMAKRNINSIGTKRNEITELVITNYT